MIGLYAGGYEIEDVQEEMEADDNQKGDIAISKYQFGKEKYYYDEGAIQVRGLDGSFRAMTLSEFTRYSRGRGYVTSADIKRANDEAIEGRFLNYGLLYSAGRLAGYPIQLLYNGGRGVYDGYFGGGKLLI